MADEYNFDEPLQRRHFSPAQWQTLEKNVRQMGRLKTRGKALNKKRLVSDSADVREDAEKWRDNVQPHLENRPISMENAKQKRTDNVYDGIDRNAREGLEELGGSGLGWYFGAHRNVLDSAEGTDFDQYRDEGKSMDRAIESSAHLSPNNKPVNEQRAIAELMVQHSDGGVQEHNSAVKAGGTGSNIGKARRHLDTGDVPPDFKREPKTGPYGTNIKNALPTIRHIMETDPETGEERKAGEDFYAMNPKFPEGTPMWEQEYMERGRLMEGMRLGIIPKGQMSLDFTGLRDSREGILNPEGPTAEDTWMNAQTYDQDWDKRGSGGNSVIAKTAASEQGLSLGVNNKPYNGKGPNAFPGAGPRQLMAAYNNEATVQSARQIGDDLGVVDSEGRSIVPDVMAQEVSWTEKRRAVGKDDEYNALQKQRAGDAEAAKAMEAQRLGLSKAADAEAQKRYGGGKNAVGWQGEQLTLPGF